MHTYTCVRCHAEVTSRRHHQQVMCVGCKVKHSEEGWKAILAVRKAVKAGLLPRAAECACEDCGKPARDWDHRDYTKPLDVQSVCRSCNARRGCAFDSVYRPQAEAA
jgi:hypothetical protein